MFSGNGTQSRGCIFLVSEMNYSNFSVEQHFENVQLHEVRMKEQAGRLKYGPGFHFPIR
jgi:hypothetical protein